MTKREKLAELEAAMEADSLLPLSPANLVFGEGSIDCRVMFIGEAPGQKEDELRRPFVGRSGQLLTKMIEKIGWKREDVYITNIVKRRPPENRDPNSGEIEAYTPYLSSQIDSIRPVLIATLGRFSMNYFLPDAKISRDQGTIFKEKGNFILPMFHPAAALRNPKMMRHFEATFLKLPETLEQCVRLASSFPDVSIGREK